MSVLKITIKTPARLHFGVVNPFNPEYRYYGSAGVAIDKPSNIVTVYSNEDFSVTGCRSSEVLDKVKTLVEEYNIKRGRVIIESCIPEHTGLGSTTQLLLAVAHGLLLANNLSEDLRLVAKKLSIGRISGVGTYIYMFGGFVVDAGKRSPEEFPKLLLRLDMPEDWYFVVLVPPGRGLREHEEASVFTSGYRAREDLVWRASFVLYHELIPSIIDRDFNKFSRSLAELQETIGEIFSVFQGGVFAKYSQEAISILRELGVVGVGQSSWGPAVYGATNSLEEAEFIAENAARKLGEGVRVYVARPVNRGAQVKVSTC
ncbi:MAG: GHMP kinase [Desulfurococcaceae archaeon]|nr:GHMP kinase [Desulfurococcaceae archaeon]